MKKLSKSQMRTEILQSIQTKKQNGRKMLAVLLDPDKTDFANLADFVQDCQFSQIDYFFVGGSLISNYQLAEVCQCIKANSNIPVVLFPGSSLHISHEADAILLLSLLSGRNAEYLIGQHVAAAPILKKSKLEILPTGYLLIDGGQATTVSYISNTSPIPADKPQIAAITALAGQQLGLQLIYLDAGSGAKTPVSSATIKAVSEYTELPLVVGGGINTSEKAQNAWASGADLIVVGNKLEEDTNFLKNLTEIKDRFNKTVTV